jgi:tetratricopeptide (TPR) repeat protein
MIETFQKLLEFKPDTKAAPSAWFWTGQGYFELKKYEDCIAPFEKARKLDSGAYDKEASLKIMLAYFFLRDLENLTQAVETERRKPDGPSRVPRAVYQFMGLKYFELERMPQADQYLSFASNPTEPDQTDYRIWYTLSEARLQNNHFDGALFAAEQFLKKADLPPSQQAKGLLNKATAYYQMKKYNDAKPIVNEALRLQPEARVQAYLRILLGDIAAAEGRFDDAAQSYVVPSQMFDDTEITPLALWKTVQALEKGGKAADAIGYKQDLEKRFPRFTPPEGGVAVPPTAGSREVVPEEGGLMSDDEEESATEPAATPPAAPAANPSPTQ